MTPRQLAPPAAILAGVAVLTLFAFRTVIADSERLPGIDAPIRYAWEVYTRSVLEDGRLPHWNPYSWAGTPFFAASSTGVLYPPAMLLRWLPPAMFLQWMVILHLLVGAAGTLYLARVIGIGWWGGAAAALSVTLGGATGAWVHQGAATLLYSAAWLPWALALAMRSVERGRLLPLVALPLVLVTQFLANLQSALYVAGAVGLFYVFSTVAPALGGGARWRPLAQLAVLGVLSAALSAFQLLPVWELAGDSTRMAGLPYERAAAGGWAWRDLATIFWPFMNSEQQPVFRYLAHRVAYIGWLAACLIPFAFLDRTHRRTMVFFAVLALVSIGLALGSATPLFSAHYALFPGLRIPGRVLFLATLSLAVLGAVGLERYVALARERRWRTVAGGLALAMMAAGAAWIVAARNAASDVVPPVHLWPWLPVVSMVGLAAVATLGAARAARPALAVGLLVLALDVTAFSAGAAETVPMEPTETLREWVGPPDEGRIWSFCANRVGSNEMLVVERPGLAGTVDLDLITYAQWLQLVAMADGPSDSLGGHRIRRDLLDAANVSTLLTCEPLDDPAVTLVADVPPVMVYRNSGAWPRALWSCSALSLSRGVVAQELRLGRFEGPGRFRREPWVSVRWSADVSDERRAALERTYGLDRGRRHEGQTWRYVASNPSRENLRQLAMDDAVEDTHGLSRDSGALIPEAVLAMDPALSARSELLVGAGDCDDRAMTTVQIQDQPDGRVVATVEAPADGGFVLFSEPYYRERHAFVDGERVTAHPANLAFTAVEVPAGRHQVELRMVPRTFYLGTAVSALALVCWGIGAAVAVRPVSGGGARRKGRMDVHPISNPQ